MSNKKSSKYKNFVTIILLCAEKKPSKKPTSYLVKVGRDTLLDKQIKAIHSKFENYELIVSTGSSIEDVYSHIRSKHPNKPVRVIENTRHDQTNSCEVARLCLNNTMNDNILFIDGGILFENKALDGLDFSNSFAMLNEKTEETLEIGVNTDNHRITFFCYGASKPWCEILFIKGRSVVDDLRFILREKCSKKMFFFEAINELIVKHPILEKRNKKKLIKISSVKTLQNARSKNEVYSR